MLLSTLFRILLSCNFERTVLVVFGQKKIQWWAIKKRVLLSRECWSDSFLDVVKNSIQVLEASLFTLIFVLRTSSFREQLSTDTSRQITLYRSNSRRMTCFMTLLHWDYFTQTFLMKLACRSLLFPLLLAFSAWSIGNESSARRPASLQRRHSWEEWRIAWRVVRTSAL